MIYIYLNILLIYWYSNFLANKNSFKTSIKFSIIKTFKKYFIYIFNIYLSTYILFIKYILIY